MNTVDARGYSCPEPVLMTQRAVKSGLPLTVLVDNMTAVNNITRFANNAGYVVKSKEVGSDFELLINKD